MPKPLNPPACLLLLICACLHGTVCMAGDEEEMNLREHFLTTLGVRRIAGMIIDGSEGLDGAVRGRLRVKPVEIKPMGEGRGVEKREIEIILADGAQDEKTGRRVKMTFTGAEREVDRPVAESITLFDRLMHWRWHESPGEVVILRKALPQVVGEEFAADVIKLPAGSLAWLEQALGRRRKNSEWFADGSMTDRQADGIKSELKHADPLWALVLRMRLYSEGHVEFVQDWGNEARQHAVYDAALVMHMLSGQKTLPLTFEPMVAASLHKSGAGNGLALGALCSGAQNSHGLLCWYQCGFVHPKQGVAWEDWTELAPAISMCPPYSLACQLCLAHARSPRRPDNALMRRILWEMGLLEKP